MNDIALITPPDFLYNDAMSICIICPSKDTKTLLNSVLLSTTIPINVMIYETPSDGFHNIEWLLTAVKMSDCVIIDVDHCDDIVKQFSSHIIAQPQTFYLTNNSHIPYNLISKSRVYDFAWLESFINRGKNEQTKE